MVYIPSNKVKTGKTASTSEGWVYKDNNDSYIGPYWSLFTGAHYAGVSPQQKPWREIIQSQDIEESLEVANPPSIIAFIDGSEKQFEEEGLEYNENMVFNYATIKQVDLDNINSTSKKLPITFYPKPTDENYELGVMIRYFAKVINQNKWIEINEETYGKLESKDKSWLWKHYNVYRLQWTLTGKEDEVSEANRTEIQILEQFGKVTGLSLYLQLNYTQFYLGEIQENLETKGQEYLLPDGKEYIGFYHIHPTKGAMVGKLHTKIPHSSLVPYFKEPKIQETPPTGSLKTKSKNLIDYEPKNKNKFEGRTMSSGGSGGGY